MKEKDEKKNKKIVVDVFYYSRFFLLNSFECNINEC